MKAAICEWLCLYLIGACGVHGCILLTDTDQYTNHVTFSKRVDTLICHTTMRRNSINFLYNPGHVTL